MEVFTGEGISSFFRYLALPTYLLYDFPIFHLLSFHCWFFQRNFKELVPGLVAVGERETVHAPTLRRRIDFRWFDESVADPKTFAPANTNYLETNSGIGTAGPTLLIKCNVAFASDLAVIEPGALKFFAQWLIGMAFFSTSLSRSRRFVGRWRSQVADEGSTAFLSGGGG